MQLLICHNCKKNINSGCNIYYAYDKSYCTANCRLISFRENLASKTQEDYTIKHIADTKINNVDNETDTCSSSGSDSSSDTLLIKTKSKSSNALDTLNYTYMSNSIKENKISQNISVLDHTIYEKNRECNIFIEYSITIVVNIVKLLYRF